LDEAIDAEAMVAHLGGAMDVGLDDYSLDDPISDIQADGDRSLLDWVQASVVGRSATVRDVGLLASQASRVIGIPEHIADQLALRAYIWTYCQTRSVTVETRLDKMGKTQGYYTRFFFDVGEFQYRDILPVRWLYTH
jgi:hypothetical protein